MRSPKEKLRPELWGLQHLYDREAKRNQKRRLKMSGQRKRSWACGVFGVKWRKYFRKETAVNSVRSLAGFTKIGIPIRENRTRREDTQLLWLSKVTHLACGRFKIQKPWLFGLNSSSSTENKRKFSPSICNISYICSSLCFSAFFFAKWRFPWLSKTKETKWGKISFEVLLKIIVSLKLWE